MKKKNSSGNGHGPSHEEIARMAAHLWEEEGRLAGRDLEYWLRAEQQLLAASRAVKTRAPAAAAGTGNR